MSVFNLLKSPNIVSPDVFRYQLGALLTNNKTLIEALRILADSPIPVNMSAGAQKIVQFLEQGENCNENEFRRALPFLPNRFLYALALPVSDKIKGELLSGWKYTEFYMYSFLKYISLTIKSLAFGALVFLIHLRFVIPQFFEIMPELYTEKLWISEFFISYFFAENSYLLVLLIPLLVLAFIFLIVKIFLHFYGVNKLCDRINLLRMLAVVPQKDRLNVLSLMSRSDIFKTEHLLYKKFANLLSDGLDIRTAAENSQLGSQFAWFIYPALKNDSDFNILITASEITEVRLNNIIEKIGYIIACLGTLIEGVLFASVFFIIFYSMSEIFLGAML